MATVIESIPGYNIAVDAWNEYAGEKFQTKDPFEEKLENGETRRRRAPEGSSPAMAKSWKKIQSTAWTHDRCFMGCYPVDCGIGLAPVLSILPVIGPILMYGIHARLITRAERELKIPGDLSAKLYANILFDFLITITPIVGALFSWLNGCSTRNAAMVHTYLKKRVKKERAQLGDFELVETTRPINVDSFNNGPGRPQSKRTVTQNSANRFQGMNVPTGHDQYIHSTHTQPLMQTQQPQPRGQPILVTSPPPPPKQSMSFVGRISTKSKSKPDPNALFVPYKPIDKPGKSGPQQSGVL